jgi:hypothetical protein
MGVELFSTIAPSSLPDWVQVGDLLGIALQGAIAGKRSARDALDNANRKITAPGRVLRRSRRKPGAGAERAVSRSGSWRDTRSSCSTKSSRSEHRRLGCTPIGDLLGWPPETWRLVFRRTL